MVGVAKILPSFLWHEQHIGPKANSDYHDFPVYQHFLNILEENFGMAPVTELLNLSNQSLPDILQQHTISPREAECLFHICRGKSYKETARVLEISPRTVETHIEHIRNKTDCRNKVDIISKFSQYFQQLTVPPMISHPG